MNAHRTTAWMAIGGAAINFTHGYITTGALMIAFAASLIIMSNDR